MFKKSVPKPHRITWWTWFINDIILLLSSWGSGATVTLTLVFAYTLGAGAVAILSLRHGVGGSSNTDKLSITLIAVAIIASRITSNPEIALLLSVAVGIIGSWHTVKKAWVSKSEDFFFWMLVTIAATGNVISINDWSSWQIIIMPVSFLLVELLVFLPLLIQRFSKQSVEE